MKIVLNEKGDMGINPARVNVDTGLIEINPIIWNDFSAIQQELILLHEQGHIAYDTVNNEVLADKYMLDRFAGTQSHSLRLAVKNILDILDRPGVPEDRKIDLIKNALAIDAEVYGNQNAAQILEQIGAADFIPEKNLNGGKVAYDAGISAMVAGIVTAAVSLASLITTTLFGRRNEWGRGKKSEHTAYRVDTIRLSTRAAANEVLSQYAAQGELKVREVIRAEDFKNRVLAVMVKTNVFTDRNILTKDWRNPKDFYSEKNYGWTVSYIEETAENEIIKFRQIFEQAGFPDPDKKNSKSNNTLYIIAALVGIILLIKFIK